MSRVYEKVAPRGGFDLEATMKAGKILVRTCAGLTVVAALLSVGLTTTASASGTGPLPSSIANFIINGTTFSFEVGVVDPSVALLVTPTGTVTITDTVGGAAITVPLPANCLGVEYAQVNPCAVSATLPFEISGNDFVTATYNGDQFLAPSSTTIGPVF
jgi:hypothetical protein